MDKLYIILLILLFQWTFSFSQSDLEIYKPLLMEYTIKNGQPLNGTRFPKTLIVFNVPNYLPKLVVSDFHRFKGKYKKLEKSTYENFIAQRNKKLKLQGFQFNNIKTVIIENDSTEPSTQELIKSYPNWDLMFYELSNVGFNNEKTQAFVYYGFQSQTIGIGGGIYLIYKKRKRGWKKVKTIAAWAS